MIFSMLQWDHTMAREHALPKGTPTTTNQICDRNALKISYSCMDNIATITKAHNNRVINANRYSETCNCRKKDDCPLPGKCTTKNIVYEAKVVTPNDEKLYIGLTSTSFKARYATHKASFTHQEKRYQTELSKHTWMLKDDGTPYTISW